MNLLGIALGLAMDALAVSIAAGLTLPRVTHRHVFRLAFHFGLFQFLMPVIGWLAGRTVAACIGSYDHWIVFGMLGFIGGKMVWDAWKHDQVEQREDPTRGWKLVMLSVATSLDALAVGLSLAFLRVSIWGPSIVIGLVAGVLTMLGIRFGSQIGARFGRWAEVGGGLVLIGIGVRVLALHCLA
jgi:manganese efflux pump family protein